MFRRLLYVCLLSLAALHAAPAATIDYSDVPMEDGTTLPVITIDGELTKYDLFTFRDAADARPGRAVVLFNSPGGDLEAGIGIGREIRQRGYSTAVIETCASACALAWLAGRLIMASDEANIGFHVAYVDGALKEQSGMGNALVGLYLGELGLGQNVVRYVTSAPPTGMQWLNFRDAELLGIDVTRLGAAQEVASAPSQPQDDFTPLPLSQAIAGFDIENAQRAVTNGLKRFGDAGIGGLAESSQACWRVVGQKRSLDAVQYCRVLDLLAIALDQEAARSYGMPSLPYFAMEGRIDDLIVGLVTVGVSEPTHAKTLEDLWSRQMTAALAAAN
jgi:hypothetical protein